MRRVLFLVLLQIINRKNIAKVSPRIALRPSCSSQNSFETKSCRSACYVVMADGDLYLKQIPFR